MNTPTTNTMKTQTTDTIIIGGGQAGMSASYWLKQHNIDHFVVEKSEEIANNWKNERWDAFCLVTPNWQCQLPGYPYQGDEPNGFMVKDEIVEYLKSYYEFVKPPMLLGKRVTSVTKQGEQFIVDTADKNNTQIRFVANNVIVATGGYHDPIILPFAENMPANVKHVHSRDYKKSADLPEGEVMVVGTGQSGCQIAEDLHLAGRKVHLCVGPAPRVNRRYRGRDVVDWLEDMGYYNTTIDTHPDGERAPQSTNHYVTGRDGGRDLNLRVFAEQGMKLYGLLKNAKDGVITFEDDLKNNLDYADSVAKRIRDSIEKYIQENDIDAPADDNIHSEFTPETPLEFDMSESGITSVVWATGFRTNFKYIHLPAFDERGRPQTKRGVTDVEGLYFLGLNWMHTWGSGRFYHVGRDAEFLVSQIAEKTKENAPA